MNDHPSPALEVSSLGLPRAGIENRSTGLVHEELGRELEVGDQRIEDGAQFECCPAAQSASVERSRLMPWRPMI